MPRVVDAVETWPHEEGSLHEPTRHPGSARRRLLGSPRTWVLALALVGWLNWLLLRRPADWDEPLILRWLRSLAERPARSTLVLGLLLRALEAHTSSRGVDASAASDGEGFERGGDAP